MRELPRGTYGLWLVTGICLVVLSVKGLADGRITAVSAQQFLSSTVARATQPQAFWALELTYFFGGVVLLLAALARLRATRASHRASYTGRPAAAAMAEMERAARARGNAASRAPKAATKTDAPIAGATPVYRPERTPAARPAPFAAPGGFPSARAVSALQSRFRLVAGLIAVVAGGALIALAAWFMHLDPLMNFLFVAIFGGGGVIIALAGIGYIVTGRWS